MQLHGISTAMWVQDGTRLRVKRGEITFFNLHLIPNETTPDFRRRFNGMEDAVLGIARRILVADDCWGP